MQIRPQRPHLLITICLPPPIRLHTGSKQPFQTSVNLYVHLFVCVCPSFLFPPCLPLGLQINFRLLLPKQSSDLKCCQPTRDLGSHVSSLVCFPALRLVLQCSKLALWAEPFKGTKSCRTQGDFFLSVCSFIDLSIHQPAPPMPSQA